MSHLDLTHSHIDTDAARIHVESAGSGAPALVFLHYWGGSARTWHPIMERLAPTWRCVALDHRGWGDSSAPSSGYAITDLADDAAAVIAALGLTEYLLVGHSMGGKVAQLLASHHPAGLAGVILVAPAPARPAAIPEAVRDALAHAYDSRESVIAALDGELTHAPLSASLREQVIADSLAGASPAKAEWPAVAIVQDVSADLDRIDVPVRVIVGAEDRVEPVELMRSHVLDVIPGAELEVVSGAGHLLPLEAPSPLAESISAFLESQRG